MGEQGPEIERRVLGDVGSACRIYVGRQRVIDKLNLQISFAICRFHRPFGQGGEPALSYRDFRGIEALGKGKVGSSAMPHKRNPDLQVYVGLDTESSTTLNL
jgi:hypothetical protein